MRLKEQLHRGQTLNSFICINSISKAASESLFVYDTYQFDDYSKYDATAAVFDVEAKAKRRKEEFPKDCQKAFEMGVRVSQTIE